MPPETRCQPERSEAKSKDPAKLLSCFATGFLDLARNDYLPLGNVGCLFAATMNATPMATRKNEKNWPRVNGPINSASGSRKFSTTIRKIA
jgi:hypothetical protein